MAVHPDAVGLPDQLEIVARERGTTMTIELAGEWDLAGGPAIRQTLGAALMSRPECVVLDLSRLAFIDSSGLHATIEFARRAAAQNIRLVIMPGPSAVQRVFEITGMAERLPFVDKQAEGFRAARSRSAGDGAAGSGGSLPPTGAGRPKAAGTGY